MRIVMAAVLAMTASAAMAGEIEEAHRTALTGRRLVLELSRSRI